MKEREKNKGRRGVGFHRKLGFRQALLVSLLVVTASWGAIALSFRAQRELIRTGRDATAATLARIIAYDIVNDLAGGAYDSIEETARRILSANPNIAYCVVHDESGAVVFDSRPAQAEPADPDPLAPRAFEVGVGLPLMVQTGWDPDRPGDSIEVAVPVVESNRKFGAVRLGYRHENFFNNEYADRIYSLAAATRRGVEDRLAGFDLEGVQAFLTKLVRDDPQMEYCIYTDWTGNELFNIQAVAAEGDDGPPYSSVLDEVTWLRPLATALIKDHKSRPKRLEVGMAVGRRTRGGELRPEGRLVLGYSMSAVNQEVRSWARRNVSYALLFALGGVLLAIWVAAGIAHPISRLARLAQAVAEGDLDVRADVRSGGEELTTLGRAFDEMISSLRQKAKTDRDLEVAHDLQMSLLPKRMPAVEGLELAGRCVPSQAVGGDLYAVNLTRDDKVSLAMGDVTGHGLASAMIMAQCVYAAKYFGYQEAARGTSPAAILRSVSEALYEELSNSGRLLTLFLGIYNPRTRRLKYASAGHPPALVVQDRGRTRQLDATTFPLGVHKEVPDNRSEIKLQRGDLVAIFTDGITEAGDPEESRAFETARLQELLTANSHKPLTEIIDLVFAAVGEFHEQNAAPGAEPDDRTLLLMRVL